MKLPAAGIEKDRQADHEPDSRAPNRKMRAAASRLTPRDLANSSRTVFEAFALPSCAAGSDNSPATKIAADAAPPSARARRGSPATSQQQAADEEADALHGVLRAGEPGDPFEQLARAVAPTSP